MLDIYNEAPRKFIAYNHSRTENPIAADFHLHNTYEIYFFISGNVNFFIENKFYPLQYGDLLVMNSHEIHKPSFYLPASYERIVIHFDPAVIRLFNSSGSNLLGCFENRPKGELNKINLSKIQVNELLDHYRRMDIARKDKHPESGILALACLLEILVLLNRSYSGASESEDLSILPHKLIPVLEYIDSNLQENLSLESLSKNFFLNSSYLCRLFKKGTGSTIHEYILFKRISKAKKLLSEGLSVTEASMLCGFNDYSNFSRMFKRTVGVSPGKYGKGCAPYIR